MGKIGLPGARLGASIDGNGWLVLQTYMPEYDKLGRGEVLDSCAICRGAYSCERCVLRQNYKDEINGMPLGPGGRLRRLKSISDFLTKSGQPPLDFKEPERYKRPTFKQRWGRLFGGGRGSGGGEEEENDDGDKQSAKALKNVSALQKDFAGAKI